MKKLIISFSLASLCACQDYGQPTETRSISTGGNYGSRDSEGSPSSDPKAPPTDKAPNDETRDEEKPIVLNIAETPPEKLPETLEQLAMYDSKGVLNEKIPFLDYQVNAPLWSDGAIKQRLLLVPKGNETLTVPENGQIVFPSGTILVKHFISEQDKYPVETRMMLKKADASWEFATYRWAADGSTKRMKKAEVIAPNAAWPNGYRVPAEAECASCHNPDTAEVIGFAPHQMKSDLDRFATKRILRDSGLERFRRGTPQPDVNNKMLSAESRAKSYLDVNCSNCHNPKSLLKLSVLGSSEMNWPALLKAPEKLTGNDLVDSPVITPGNPEKSKLYLRFVAKKNRMPANSVVVDPVGEEILRTWINNLPLTCTAADTATCVERPAMVGR